MLSFNFLIREQMPIEEINPNKIDVKLGQFKEFQTLA